MKHAIDTPCGRTLYGRRIAIVGPVFANLRHTSAWIASRCERNRKVNTQWNLYRLVHNIEKLAHHGSAR